MQEFCIELSDLLSDSARLVECRAELAQYRWQPIDTAPHETPVLVVRLGKVCIAEKRTEYPTWEEDFKPYDYWDDPNNDGQDWTDQITHWMPLPALPTT